MVYPVNTIDFDYGKYRRKAILKDYASIAVGGAIIGGGLSAIRKEGTKAIAKNAGSWAGIVVLFNAAIDLARKIFG